MGSLGFGVGETRRTNLDPAACHPASVVERRSLSGAAVFGTVAGSRIDIPHSADGAFLILTETLSSGGSPSSRFDRLEYRFTVDVAPGERIHLLVRGERSDYFHEDDFRFEWSTNGTTFTPVPMESLPVDVDDGRFRVGELPPTLVGSITLRVVDTDRTAGHQAIDQVRIDALLVRTVSP